jgi:FkbM family methyltransferase
VQLFYKLIYNPFINRVILKFLRLLSPLIEFRLPPAGVITLAISNELSIKLCTNQTSYVSKLLFWEGVDSFEYTSIFKLLVQRVDSFIDIGANTGYYSLLAGSLNKKITVHAFEPARGPHHYLLKNIQINNLSDIIKAHSMALSNTSGTCKFFEIQNQKYTYLKYNLGGVGSTQPNTNLVRNSSVVKTDTLDNFIKENSIHKVDLIKIDTEGSENFILEGARECIIKHKPIIICETLFNKIEPELERIMQQHGYLFFNHVKKKLIQVKTLTRTTDNRVRDCFFVHPKKIFLIEDFI